MGRPALAALAAATMTITTVTASWSAPTPALATTTSAASYQTAAFAATNAQRQRHDRRALRHQRCVQRYAVRQAQRMARQHRMFHQDLQPVLRDCGLSTAGENVAYGFPSGRSVVVDGWMKSPPHRRNILRSDYRLLGVGARRSGDGTWYVSQVFGRRG
jgi:uncharacterized protein YkwD